MTTPANELRTAAEKLRTLTSDASYGPWRTEWNDQQYQLHGNHPDPTPLAEWTFAIVTWGPKAVDQRAECDTGDADYIAAMHPGVGSALANWLESTATSLTANTHPDWQECVAPDALAVARAINGGQS